MASSALLDTLRPDSAVPSPLQRTPSPLERGHGFVSTHVFYLDLFRCLALHEVRYVLVGGLAMNLLGVPRLTMEVDLLLGLEEQNIDAFIQCANALRLRSQISESLAALRDPARRLAWYEDNDLVAFALSADEPGAPTVDLVLQHPLDFAAAHARALLRDAGGVTVRIASVEDMIALKRAARRIWPTWSTWNDLSEAIDAIPTRHQARWVLVLGERRAATRVRAAFGPRAPEVAG